eukprot:7384229-Prymnesium_polylepis.1
MGAQADFVGKQRAAEEPRVPGVQARLWAALVTAVRRDARRGHLFSPLCRQTRAREPHSGRSGSSAPTLPVDEPVRRNPASQAIRQA